MRRYTILAAVVLTLAVAASVVYARNTEITKAKSTDQSSQSFVWSWRQPPYVTYGSGGYPYVFPGVYVLARDPLNSDLIYAGTDNTGLCCGSTAPPDGIYRTLDRGATWQYLSKVDPDQRITRIVVHPITPTIIFAGFRHDFPGQIGGVYKSVDGGFHWNSVLPSVSVHDIEIVPSEPNVIYATGGPATERWGIYRSINVGETWQRISDHWAEDLVIHPITPTILFSAGSINGIFRSDDSGIQWTQLENIGPMLNIVIDQQNPSRMFVFGSSYAGIWKTENGGESWVSAVSNLPDVGFWLTILSAAIDPENNEIWVGLKYSGMFVSTDGANSWNEFTNGLPFVGASNSGPQCEAIALAADGAHAIACQGRFYTRELVRFSFLPLIIQGVETGRSH